MGGGTPRCLSHGGVPLVQLLHQKLEIELLAAVEALPQLQLPLLLKQRKFPRAKQENIDCQEGLGASLTRTARRLACRAHKGNNCRLPLVRQRRHSSSTRHL